MMHRVAVHVAMWYTDVRSTTCITNEYYGNSSRHTMYVPCNVARLGLASTYMG